MTLKTWSFSKKINSTAQPAGASRDYTVYMKENTSIERPVFIIGTGIDANINYCQWNGNYYFIDDIVLISADQVELHCSIDVLATHKTAIGDYSAFIERASTGFDNMIIDGAVSATQEVIKEDNIGTDIFNVNEVGGVYVLKVIGAYGSNTAGIATYILETSQLEEVLDFMFNDGQFTDILTDAVVKSFFNPFQYIVGLMWLPLSTAAFGGMTAKTVKFGWWQTNNTYNLCNVKVINKQNIELTVPTGYYADFRSYDHRFTQYTVRIPTVGTIQIDPSVLSADGKLYLDLTLDIATGATYVVLKTTDSIIGTYSGNMGVNVPVGQVNGEGGSLLSSLGQLGIGAFIGNPAALIGGVAGVAGSYNPPPSMIGNYGSVASAPASVTARVNIRCYKTGDLLTSRYGRPVEGMKTINTLSGFIKCRMASISLAAPDSEIETVNNYLNSGFYYE